MNTPAPAEWIRDKQPAAPGRYEVSPFKTVEMVSEACWDGRVWRYLDSDRECYIQNLAWRYPDHAQAA